MAQSDISDLARRFLRALRPDVPVFPSATHPDALQAPESDIVFIGFPCVHFSRLHRTATAEDILKDLSTLDRALGYVRLRNPPIIILENFWRGYSPDTARPAVGV